MPERNSDVNLERFLQGLDRRHDDEVVRATLHGRALSRSDESLHLSSPTGVVAVPIKNIERVISVSANRSDIVRVVVRNPNEIRTLVRATPRSADRPAEVEGGAAARFGPGTTVRGEKISSGWGVGVSTCDYYDTSTITGDEADACDDTEEVCQADDIE